MAALDALSAAERVDLLITRIGFPPGKPHGISLARMAKSRRPAIRVLFTTRPEFVGHIGDIGEVLPTPIDIPTLLAVAERLLNFDAEAGSKTAAE